MAGALIGLGALAALPLAVGIGRLASALGLIDAAEGLGIAALVGGLVVHIGAVEVGRAQLLVGRVTLASLLRGVLMLALGSAALWVAPSASDLLLAIGTAHVLAALPVILALRRTIWRQWLCLAGARGDAGDCRLWLAADPGVGGRRRWQ